MQQLGGRRAVLQIHSKLTEPAIVCHMCYCSNRHRRFHGPKQLALLCVRTGDATHEWSARHHVPSRSIYWIHAEEYTRTLHLVGDVHLTSSACPSTHKNSTCAIRAQFCVASSIYHTPIPRVGLQANRTSLPLPRKHWSISFFFSKYMAGEFPRSWVD